MAAKDVTSFGTVSYFELDNKSRTYSGQADDGKGHELVMVELQSETRKFHVAIGDCHVVDCDVLSKCHSFLSFRLYLCPFDPEQKRKHHLTASGFRNPTGLNA